MAHLRAKAVTESESEENLLFLNELIEISRADIKKIGDTKIYKQNMTFEEC